MALEPKSKTIDGIRFVVTPFPAREANRILITLTSYFGRPMASLAALFLRGDGSAPPDADGDELPTAAIDALGDAVRMLFQELDEDKADALVTRLTSRTTANGQPIADAVFDVMFMGRLKLLYRVLAFVLEVNYGDFFDGADALRQTVTGFTKSRPGSMEAPPEA
jgi:hypothetical protein